MATTVTYRIVTGSNTLDLVDQVNALLKRGWVLVGGLVVQGSMYAQAMTYTDKNSYA